MSDSRSDTLEHIRQVQRLMTHLITELRKRRAEHDQSKLGSPEVEGFDRYTPLLAKTTYGSPEYMRLLAEMAPFLEHHYLHNRHHPEHFLNGVRDMDLVDLAEMLCDWMAATFRHETGDVRQSIEVNQQRFRFPDYLADILLNTVEFIEGQARIKE